MSVARPFDKCYDIVDGCWVWNRARNAGGYGSKGHDGKTWLAHRLSWLIHKGEIPEGFNVCHHCDNPPCVNPDHLFLGKQKQNMEDCAKKGRRPCFKGINHPRRKFTERQVRQIRASKTPRRKLAERFGVAKSTIDHIIQRITWSHL